jgi:phage shock protein A
MALAMIGTGSDVPRYGEFERLGDRVEMCAAAEVAYLQLDDELSGDDLRRRCADAEVDAAVEARLARLREESRPTASEGEP